MKEKHHKHKKEKKERRKRSSSSSSDEWVEKKLVKEAPAPRDDWMAMTGMLKTYTKDDVKPKREEKDKKHIDSYNPATCSRELNPYWKDGGSGLPQTSDNYRKAQTFLKPNDDNYYLKPSKDFKRPKDDDHLYRTSSSRDHHHEQKEEKSRIESSSSRKSTSSGNWRKGRSADEYQKRACENLDSKKGEFKVSKTEPLSMFEKPDKPKDGKYLSDEKMNKLAARIVKAEILGDSKLVNELKTKLEDAREYRKQNPNAGKEEEDDSIILMSTNNMGNSRPLTRTSQGDPRSKSGKRKAETHQSGERTKYFGNDDKYNLAQMFEQEKYGNNYDDEAQLASIASKHKNPNDDLEDIFTDEISKTRDSAKDDLREKERAIKQHEKMERSLEGCEHCVGSKSMLKHLMVSCGRTVYLALPAKKSLVPGHCIITTIQHAACVTSVDEDVWEEIMDYRKALTKFFNSQSQDVVFFETATRLHKYPHLVINCVPLPRDVGDMAAIYFKKALLECEAEWSMNKKVIELKGKNIRKGVPKGLPYFWVDFGTDPGFAHVIEDQQLFPRAFAEEIIGGMLDLDHSLWKNPKKEFGDQQRKKVVEFIEQWKSFDTVAK